MVKYSHTQRRKGEGKPAIEALLRKYAEKNIVVLRSREEADAFLSAL